MSLERTSVIDIYAGMLEELAIAARLLHRFSKVPLQQGGIEVTLQLSVEWLRVLEKNIVITTAKGSEYNNWLEIVEHLWFAMISHENDSQESFDALSARVIGFGELYNSSLDPGGPYLWLRKEIVPVLSDESC